MFTGIIETLGELKEISTEGSNIHLKVSSVLTPELKVDQSINHNGVCLTVTALDEGSHWVTAIDETLKKTNLGHLRAGDTLNLERCMLANGRFDGHIVQGHVDKTAVVTGIKEEEGSWLFDFSFDPGEETIVEKGSICINGVSLTCFNAGEDSFRVAIIPYTYEHTNFNQFRIGTEVNLEFDVIGKYVHRLLEKREI